MLAIAEVALVLPDSRQVRGLAGLDDVQTSNPDALLGPFDHPVDPADHENRPKRPDDLNVGSR